LFGHIHGDGGIWYDGGTCFANVTTASGRRGPTVLDIDLVRRTVEEVLVPPGSIG
jgi:hypothetical protein